MATAKPVTDGQECVSLWQAGLLMFRGAVPTRLPDYNSTCSELGCTADEWARYFEDAVLSPSSPYYVLVEDDNEE